MSEPRPALAAVRRGTHLLGVALIGLGALVALAPALTGGPVVVLVGVLVAVAGAVLVAFGWRTWSAGGGAFGLVAGVLAVACGLALVFNPVSTLDVVSSVVAVYMIVGGVSSLFLKPRLDDEGARTWVLGDALLSIALGVSMWTGWPISGLHALGLLLGAKLVSAGAVVLRVERGMRRLGTRLTALRTRLDD